MRCRGGCVGGLTRAFIAYKSHRNGSGREDKMFMFSLSRFREKQSDDDDFLCVR